eukprot:jgi/Mesen1/1226/ME000129S00324
MRSYDSSSLLDSTLDERFTDLPAEIPYLGRVSRWHPLLGLALYALILLASVVLLVTSATGLLWLKLVEPVQALVALDVLALVCSGALQCYLCTCLRGYLSRGYLSHSQHMQRLVPLPTCTASAFTALGLLLTLCPYPIRILALYIASMSEMLALGGIAFWILKEERRAQRSLPDAHVLLTSALSQAEAGGYEPDGYDYDNIGMRIGDAWLTSGGSLSVHASLLVLQLQSRASARGSGGHLRGGGGDEAWEDQAELLAAREQEVRALAGEREQLQLELQLARSHAAELQDSLQLLRDNTQKHMDENARLRLMLDEWSARSAQLE